MTNNNFNAFMLAEAKRYRKRLVRIMAANKQSGDLIKSVKVFTNASKIEVQALNYFDFQDKGVDGIKRSHGSIYEYSVGRKRSKKNKQRRKPSKMTRGRSQYDPKRMPPITAMLKMTKGNYAKANAARYTIYEQGIKPKKFLEKANKNINYKGILDAYNADIGDEIARKIKAK